MRSCFEWFYDKVKKQFKTGIDLAGFIDNIVDKLSYTVIEVTDQLNAFKVFETLNARGVQLSSSDLLKNHLFSVVDETNPHQSEIEELEKKDHVNFLDMLVQAKSDEMLEKEKEDKVKEDNSLTISNDLEYEMWYGNKHKDILDGRNK